MQRLTVRAKPAVPNPNGGKRTKKLSRLRARRRSPRGGSLGQPLMPHGTPGSLG